MDISEKNIDIDNTELLKAMDMLKADDNEENFKPFLAALSKAKFLVPAVVEKISEDENKENGEAKKNYKVNFRIITDQNKKNFFPCFTGKEVFDEWIKDDEAQKIVISFNDLSKMVLQSDGKINGFAIDPYTNGMQISTDFLKNLEKANERAKSNIKKNTLPTNTKIRLRTPKYMPVDMLENAKEYFKEHDNVKAAYIQMMEMPDADEEYLIAIDFDGNEHELFEGLMPKIKEYSFGIHIALTGTDNDLGKKVSENTEPFYERKVQ